jgi:hypothetical protein
MAARVPVLGQHHELEAAAELVDERHHLVATRHREVAAGAEVVPHVDNQQDIRVRDFVSHSRIPSGFARH